MAAVGMFTDYSGSGKGMSTSSTKTNTSTKANTSTKTNTSTKSLFKIF